MKKLFVFLFLQVLLFTVGALSSCDKEDHFAINFPFDDDYHPTDTTCLTDSLQQMP